MARMKRQFVYSNVLKDMASKIIDMYDDIFENIDLDKIYFAFCTTQPSKRAKDLIMGNVSNELIQKVANEKYQIAFYEERWHEWEEAKQLLMLFNALYSISPEFDGKLRKTDINDFYVVLKTFGLEWDWTDGNELPNILDKKIKFIFPPVKCDDDEEESNGPDTISVIEDIMNEKAKEDAAKNNDEEELEF